MCHRALLACRATFVALSAQPSNVLGVPPEAPKTALARTPLRLAWSRGLLAAALVAAAGQLATPPAFVLAVVAFFSFFDLGRRESEEAHGARDWTAWGMQASFVLILMAGAWQNRAPELAPDRPGAIEIAGVLVILAGLWLRQRTSAAMGAFFKVKIQVEDDQPLVREGPFRRIRHPSYLSLLIIALGTALSVRSPLAGLITALVWLPIMLLHIHREERTLARTFGTHWDEYRAATWRLIPGLF